MSGGDPDGRPLHLRPGAALLVAAGGAVGAPLRWLLSLALLGPSSGWPTATFVTNLLGALLLGVLLAALARTGPDTGRRRAARLALGTGVLGAFTTYSTFALEVDGLVRAGSAGTAAAYAAASVAGGLLLAAVGTAAGAALGTALAPRSAARDGGPAR